MVKNQNYHFTEIQKQLGVTIHRTDRLERVAQTIPNLELQISLTDQYLNFYQPMEICTYIHQALKASLESAPTKMKLDSIEYSQKRVKEILDKITAIGTENEEPFVKNDYKILKLDMDAFNIRNQWEEEERQRQAQEQAEAAAKLTRLSPQQVFEK